MNEFLKGILDGINSIIGNYGWSVVIFTLLIRLVIMPFDYKSRVSMRKTQKIQPQLNALQKKYANDKEKLNKKMTELYQKEKINPMSSCLPMLLTMPILFAMFAAMRMVAGEHMAAQVFDILQGNEPVLEGWLWIKNIWMPDSPFAPVIADQNSLMMITADKWSAAYAALTAEQVDVLTGLGLGADNFNSESVFAALQTLPIYAEETKLWSVMPTLNLMIANLSIYANNNGWFVLPILSAVTQFLMTKSQPQTAPADGQQNSTNNFMKYFFPLFSLWICSSYNALFSLYWVISNIIAAVQSVVMNKVMDNMDKKEKNIVKEGTVK